MRAKSTVGPTPPSSTRIFTVTGTLSPRTIHIMVYAMCGFANTASVGILIAGMGALLPDRRDEIVPLALKALLSGAMATGLSACWIGLLPV